MWRNQMLYWVTKEDFFHPAERLCQNLSHGFGKIRQLSYETIFYKRKIPGGHYIFTDFDRMSSYEIDCCIALTDAIARQSPKSLILNDPRWVLERVPLLEMLYSQQLNSFAVYRIDTGQRPKNYPVFLRSEDGCLGPGTELLNTPDEFDQAVQTLRQEGHTLKRKIAVEFCSQTDDEGWYRKYGVFNIAGTIIPSHIQRNRNWTVKSNGAQYDKEFCREEFDWVRHCPHEEQIREIFKLARIDFGRIDYTLVGGKIQTFEINTNPTFPQLKGEMDNRTDDRRKRRLHIRKEVIKALSADEFVPVPKKAISFTLPSPVLEHPKLPRRSLTGRLLKLFDRLLNLPKRLYK